MSLEELKAAAVAMLDRAYCPYSHFPVGVGNVGHIQHFHGRLDEFLFRHVLFLLKIIILNIFV